MRWYPGLVPTWGGDDAVDDLRPDQAANAHAGVAGIDGIDGQMPGAALQNAVDEPLRHPVAGLAADGDGLAILEAGDDLLPCSDFTFHVGPPFRR